MGFGRTPSSKDIRTHLRSSAAFHQETLCWLARFQKRGAMIAMATVLTISLIIAGCVMDVSPVVSEDPCCQHTEPAVVRPYIDAYAYIPDDVAWLIGGRVAGYAMPPLSRYGSELYPVRRYEPWNLPSYVRTDFNGDCIDDYAFMFSKESYSNNEWYLTTKMLIVASDDRGDYETALDLMLGTVCAPLTVEMEEYWGIRLMQRGVHILTVCRGNVIVEERLELINDGLYLASIDPAERSVFYLIGTAVYEMRWDLGALPKGKALTGVNDSRSARIIDLKRRLEP